MGLAKSSDKEGTKIVGNRRPVRKPQARAVPAQQSAPEPSRAAVPQAEAVWTPPTPRAVARLGADQRAALDRLAQTAVEIQRQQDDLAAKVAAARSHGVSWAVIGHAVGTTGEAARQRWGTRSA